MNFKSRRQVIFSQRAQRFFATSATISRNERNDFTQRAQRFCATIATIFCCDRAEIVG
jgi:hypothetical protein